MKPEWMLINWSRGSVAGCGTEAECRDQMAKALRNNDNTQSAFILAEVKVLSEMKRIES
jgi:hypothetical protein